MYDENGRFDVRTMCVCRMYCSHSKYIYQSLKIHQSLTQNASITQIRNTSITQIRNNKSTIQRYDVEDEPIEMWDIQGILKRGETEYCPIRARVSAYIGTDIKEKIKQKEQKEARIEMGMATAPKKLTKEERYHWNKNHLVGHDASSNGQVNKEGTIEMKLYGEWRESSEITFTYIVRNAEFDAKRRHRLRCSNKILSKWEYRLTGRVTQFKTFEGLWEKRKLYDNENREKADDDEEERMRMIKYERAGRFWFKIVSSQETTEKKKLHDTNGEEEKEVKLKLRRVFRDGTWITVNEKGEVVVRQKLEEEKDRLEKERRDTSCTICHKVRAVRLCHTCIYKEKEYHRYCLGCWDKRHRNVMHVYDALDPNECVECGGHAVLYCKECEDQFCYQCFRNLHRAPGRRTHEVERLSSGRWVLSEEEDEKINCGRCAKELANRYCKKCEENYCESCWHTVHRKGKRKGHECEGVNGFVIE